MLVPNAVNNQSKTINTQCRNVEIKQHFGRCFEGPWRLLGRACLGKAANDKLVLGSLGGPWEGRVGIDPYPEGSGM